MIGPRIAQGASAELRITDSATRSRISLPLPPTPGGTTGRFPMLLEAGPTVLRIESARSTFALEWIRVRKP